MQLEKQNPPEATAVERAGIGVRELSNLESGNGSSLNTLVHMLRALGAEKWLETIAPIATIDPLMLTREGKAKSKQAYSK